MKVSTGTIARTVVLVITMINLVLSYLGIEILPFTSEEVNDVIAVVAAMVASAVAWWKNNSFTQNALKADATLAELKK